MNLLKNYLSLAGAEVLSKLATFAAFAYLARVVGPDSFGLVEFAGAALMCASLIVDQGFSPFGAREIAKDPQQTRRLTSEVVTARFVLAALSYVALFVFGLMVDRGPVVMRLLLVYGLSLWLLPLLLSWVFQGHERMHLVAVAQVIRQTVFAVTVFAFVRGPEQILMVAWAEVAGVTGAAIFCVWMLRRHFKEHTPTGPSVSAQLFREGVPIGMSQMFWVVKMFGGTLILGLIATSQQVGFFAGAQRILVALHTFVWLYFFNLFPSLSRNWQREDGSFQQQVDRSFHTVAWLAIVGGLVWVLLATDAMRIAYGRDFAPAGPVLAVMAGVCVMAFINGHYRFGLIASGRQSIEMLISAVGAVVALVLIPFLYSRWGLTGAAAALVATETVIWFLSWFFSVRLLKLNGHAKLLLRPLIALALAAAVLWLPMDLGRIRSALSLLVLLIVAIAVDAKLRERLFELFVYARTWIDRRRAAELPKAHGGISL